MYTPLLNAYCFKKAHPILARNSYNAGIYITEAASEEYVPHTEQ